MATPEEMRALAIAKQKQAAAKRAKAPGPIRSGIAALGNGLSMGFDDELTGALGVLTGASTDEEGNTRFFDYSVPASERYTSTRDRIRDRDETMREAHPYVSMAGDITGGAITAGATLPAAAGATLLRTLGRAGAIGAAEGGAIGAGNADGDGVVREAGTGAAVGGLVGPAMVPVASTIRAAGNAVADPISGVVDAMMGRASPRRAAPHIARALKRSGKSVEQVQEEVAKAGMEGQAEYVVADALGNPGQRALAGIARTPGAARTEVVEALERRQMGQGDRVGGFVTEALGTPDTAAQRRAAMTAARDTEANRLYTAAREGAGPVDVRGAVGVIEDRIGPMRNSGVTGDGIDARLSRYWDRLMAANPPGDTLSVELSDFNRVLGVKQDLSDDIAVARRAGRDNEARELMRLKDALDQALEASSDGYRAANDDFARQSRAIDAIDAGEAAAQPRRRAEDLAAQYRAMDPRQQAGFRSGFADRAMGRIENAPPGTNSARDFTRPRNAQLMREMSTSSPGTLGTQAADPDLFGRRIGRENTMFETRRQAVGGSQTADNLADQSDVAGNIGIIANLLAARPLSAAAQIGGRLNNVATGMNEETQLLIARALLSRDPQAALAPLMREAGLDEAATRRVQALLRSGGHHGSERLGLR